MPHVKYICSNKATFGGIIGFKTGVCLSNRCSCHCWTVVCYFVDYYGSAIDGQQLDTEMSGARGKPKMTYRLCKAEQMCYVA